MSTTVKSHDLHKLLPAFLKDHKNEFHHIYYAFTVEHVNLCCNFILQKNIHFVTIDIEIQTTQDSGKCNQWHSYVKRTEYDSISLLTIHVGNVSFVMNIANISKNYGFSFRECDPLIVLLNSHSISKIVFSQSDEMMLNQNGISIQNTIDIQQVASLMYKIQHNWDTSTVKISLKKCCEWLKMKTGDFRLTKYNSDHSCYDNPRIKDIIYASNDAYVTHQCFLHFNNLFGYETDRRTEFLRWYKSEFNDLVKCMGNEDFVHDSYEISFWFGKNNSKYFKKRLEQLNCHKITFSQIN